MRYNRKFLDAYAKLNNRGCTLSIEMGEQEKMETERERESQRDKKKKIKFNENE